MEMKREAYLEHDAWEELEVAKARRDKVILNGESVEEAETRVVRAREAWHTAYFNLMRACIRRC
jgi:hypothetical protein